ncbi:uncharacterized protein PRCAT00005250001 [Priceomyces carsonii]|uniref:uncharacterized protein n=1 Tax=Priceomyces carsonii TaxID=28549 RepID=UPI002ED8D248|nr:unnamed protein product [Priceomyces carsonii]
MDLLISNQANGSLRVIRIKKQNGQYHAKFKCEKLSHGSADYIQKLEVFKFQGNHCLALARKCGLVQLYEGPIEGKKTLILRKVWKHANINGDDLIISMGIVGNRYLYTCSSEGKLVFRDLIHDDDDDSYRVYLINDPISAVKIKFLTKLQRMVVASAGKNNELRLYEIGLGAKCKFPVDTSEIRSTISNRSGVLRRTITSLNLASSFLEGQTRSLVPFWTSRSSYLEYIYKSNSFESISNWIVSTCFYLSHSRDLIICGAQFGNILFYETAKAHEPVKSIQVSQFPITNLKIFNNNNLLLFSDTISKIGIIDLKSFQVVQVYDNLKFGPYNAFKFLTADHEVALRKLSKGFLFKPIYTISCSALNLLMIYVLFDDGTYDLLLELKMDSVMPSVDLMGNYENIDELFGETASNDVSYIVDLGTSLPESKRRRTQISQPSRLILSLSHFTRDIIRDEIEENDNLDQNNNLGVLGSSKISAIKQQLKYPNSRYANSL